MKFAVYKKTTEASQLGSGSVFLVKNRRCNPSSSLSASSKFLVTRRTALYAWDSVFYWCDGLGTQTTLRGSVGDAFDGQLFTPSRAGYGFTGWYYTGEDGTELECLSSTLFSVYTSEVSAHWSPAQAVALDASTNGGHSEAASVTMYAGLPVPALPTPTAPSEKPLFIGWYTAASGGTRVVEGNTYSGAYTKLYAQYEEVGLEYIAVTTASYKNTGIYTASRYSSSKPIVIDWGDGTIEAVDASISQKTHTYSSAGTFHVRINDNLTSFAPSYNNSTWYNTTSQNRYTFKSMVKTGSHMASSSAMPTYAFYYCSALSSINWLSSCYTGLTSIPTYAFYYCSSIPTLSALPARIKSLGQYAFYNCTGLTGIQDLRSTGLTSLPNSYSLANCTNVREWKLPSTLTGTYFGSYLFATNSNLSAIELPSALTSIASNCFYNDTQLKKIAIPAKVATVNSNAFYGCSTLSSVDWQTTALTSVQSYAFNNCYALRDLDLPDTTKLIGTYAFHNCRAAQASALVLPSSLTSLGEYAYQGCYSLKTLDIPSSLAALNNYAFAGCYSLSSIVDRRLTAQTAYSTTFGNTASNNATNGYTGYATRGSNILCTYVEATGYDDGIWSDPLQNSVKCGFNVQYIDPENLRYCEITFNAGDGTVDTPTKTYIQGKVMRELPSVTCPASTPYFGGWWTEQDGAGTKYSATSHAPSQSALTLYALYGTTPFQSYTVDLNGQWVQSTTQTNPDASRYDGVYESNSNYHAANSYAKMYIRIDGYDTFTIYIRSYAESRYDYTIAFNPDVDVTSLPSTTTTGVKAHTSGNQMSGQQLANYTAVTYTGLGGTSHFICVVYRKDSSADSGNDRGYLLVPKQQ